MLLIENFEKGFVDSYLFLQYVNIKFHIMIHGYKKSHPSEPLTNILQPPPQIDREKFSNFKPEIEVGQSYYFEGSGKEICNFLKNLPKEVEFVSPKDKLVNETSSKKIASEPIRFKVSPSKADAGDITNQIGKVGVRLGSQQYSDTFSSVIQAAENVTELLNSIKMNEDIITNEKISLEISSYLNPKQANVVSMETHKASANLLGEAVQAALKAKLQNKRTMNLDDFSSPSNRYMPGVESFNKDKKAIKKPLVRKMSSKRSKNKI